MAPVHANPQWQVRRYFGYCRRTFLQAFAFRTELLMWWSVVILLLYIMVAFWRAVYGATPSANGYTLPQIIAYVVGGEVLSVTLSDTARFRLDEAVRGGGIAVELTRPIALPGALLAEAVGGIVSDAGLYGVPALVAGVVLFHARFTGRADLYLVVLTLTAMGLVLRFLLSAAIGYSAFWTVQTSGIGEIFFNLFMRLFGGQWIPYAFFPGALRVILPWTPFGGIFNAPLTLLVGVGTLKGALVAALVDLAWIGLLVLVVAGLHWLAMRRVMSHGG